MAEAIGEGRWHVYGKAAVLDYCEEDVKNSAELLRRQLRGHERRAPLDPQLITRWSVYSAKSVACVQLRGIPVDMPLWNLTQENKYRVLSALLAQYDPSHGDDEPIYDADGTWSTERFIDWPNRAGIGEWPHLASGTLQLDSDAFRMMAGAHSADEKLHLALEGLQALRDTIGVLVRDRIPIGRDGRNRPSLFPFCTATGRNAHSKSLFNAHASMRSFIKFPSNKIGVYLDWRTQESPGGGASGDTRADGRLPVPRHLPRAGAHVRLDQRHRHQAVEERMCGPTPGMKALLLRFFTAWGFARWRAALAVIR